jgi:large subunit ribosomal protein L15
MKINELEITKSKKSKRAGRGIASGRGKTAGRGTKGQNSRAGSSRRPGFEGGQTPLIQHLPKLRGFKSHKKPMEVVYTGQLDNLKVKTIDNGTLADAGLVSSGYAGVKLLVKGDLSSALNIKLQAASVNAIKLVQKSGGNFVAVAQISRPALAKK